ncbi:MAG: DJ-1/PfpI family protein [Oscillospiraceae bacterium]|nr:DJ-1/PfpI family protein [Oscillospiraceae bacterium]
MVYIILGTGFEEVEAVAPCDILRRGGVEVKFAGIGGKLIKGGNGITVQADCTVEEMDLTAMDMIVLPGGMGGVNSILGCEAALSAVTYAYENGKYVAAICAAPTILAKLGVTDGKHAVVYPGMEAQMGSAMMENTDAVRDGKVLTGRAPGAALEFGYLLLKTLKDEETSQRIRSGMVYQH